MFSMGFLSSVLEPCLFLNTLNIHIIFYQEQGLGGDLVTNDGVFDHLFDQIPNLPHPLTQGNGRCIKVTPEVNSNSITNPTNFTTPISVKHNYFGYKSIAIFRIEIAYL